MRSEKSWKKQFLGFGLAGLIVFCLVAGGTTLLWAQNSSSTDPGNTAAREPNVKPVAAPQEVEALEKAEKEAEYEAEGLPPEAEGDSENAPSSARAPAPVGTEPPKKSGNAFTRFFRRLFGRDDAKTATSKSEQSDPKAQAEAPETEESQAGTPEALTPDGDTGTMDPDEFLAEEFRSASRQWEGPAFSGQESALGWQPTVFDVPEGLRKRVDFWVNVYSKYTTDQGVIHDTHHLEVVYEKVDFNQIMKDDSLTTYQKARQRERFVKARRVEYEEHLRRLAKVTTPDELTGEDLRVWKLWEPISEPNKFLNAAKKSRVRFQLGQKDKFVLGIYYSGRYIRAMEKIFRDQGLPIELTRLPFVESSFNIFARSKVGASGVWQFMRRTARSYMRVNTDVDERNDPIEATRASARLLKSNFELLDSWPLAVTGYNHGPAGMRRIANKLKTKDIVEIVDKYSSRTFGFASENFYACFLAALEVEKNARKYFGDVRWSTEFAGEEIEIVKAIPYKLLLALYNNDDNLARLHNFHLQASVRRGRSQIPRGTFIRVPQLMREQALSLINGSIAPDALTHQRPGAAALVASATPPKGAASSFIPGGPAEANAAEASADSKPSLAASSSQVPAAGTVPNVRSAESLAAEKSLGFDDEKNSGKGPRRYKVRRGDNLSRIARNYGVSIKELREVNDLGDSSRLRRGQWLTIP